MAAACLVWFRQDLRLADNPALDTAVRRGGAVLPVFIWAPDEEGRWAPGGATRWWLHQSLTQLDAELRRRGSRLLVRRGPTSAVLQELLAESGAAEVVWNRRYEPAVRARDTRLEQALRQRGVRVETGNSALLFEPSLIHTAAGAPFQVFTPFWKACQQATPPPAPTVAPRALNAPQRWPASLTIADLALQPTIDWAAGLRAAWTPGEAGAATTLDHFLDTGIAHYAPQRDHPARAGTSRLSPHLHFGEIGPRQLWHAVHSRAAHDRQPGVMRGAERYLRELGWREFAHHLLVHFTHTPEASLRSRFDSFPWADDAAALRAWQKGRTGYPIVDAGMRELWETGWMHNRVRMISFLVKDLLLSWRSGAEWFWDTLVDADLANNTLGWQWTAGCGADAAPYFRIFNPVSQGQKFDPDGAYVRRWVPALAQLPPEWIHRPWEAPAPILAAAAVRLGDTYPPPIVDRRGARQRALSALASIKKPQPAAPLG